MHQATFKWYRPTSTSSGGHFAVTTRARELNPGGCQPQAQGLHPPGCLDTQWGTYQSRTMTSNPPFRRIIRPPPRHASRSTHSLKLHGLIYLLARALWVELVDPFIECVG